LNEGWFFSGIDLMADLIVFANKEEEHSTAIGSYFLQIWWEYLLKNVKSWILLTANCFNSS
jgi:hypothetical protein